MADRHKLAERLYAPLPEVAEDAGYQNPPPRMGFFTDTSVCIGCKACEVACKEWNLLPEDGINLLGSSYDNTGQLGASTWRHVKFIEQPRVAPELHDQLAATMTGETSTTTGETAAPRIGEAAVDEDSGDGNDGLRWLMASDVCKHCTHAACLDVCPTGALIRTEMGTVIVQSDVCNGCGYCVAACPYGVVEARKDDGRAFKCTLCYDRTSSGLMPACATACPTESIQYGPLDELRERASSRAAQLQSQGESQAQLYNNTPNDGVGGAGAFFLLLDKPEVYGLPPDPVATTRDIQKMWGYAAGAALTVLASVIGSMVGRRP